MVWLFAKYLYIGGATFVLTVSIIELMQRRKFDFRTFVASLFCSMAAPFTAVIRLLGRIPFQRT